MSYFRDMHRLKYDQIALRNCLEKSGWYLAYRVPGSLPGEYGRSLPGRPMNLRMLGGNSEKREIHPNYRHCR